MTQDVFDLDAFRAAQSDESKTPLPVKFGGKVYQVPRPLPLLAVESLIAGKPIETLRSVFGADADEILQAGINSDDLLAVLNQLAGGPGKSKPSAGSSRTAGGKSKRTSNASTK